MDEIITITDKALEQIKSISRAENPDGSKGLRLAVVGGGCSGLSYKIEFSDPKERDNVLTFGDVKVLVDPKSVIYLKGIVLDFKEISADPKFVEDFFYAQKSIWNQEHDITVFNYPIELYVQDINAKLVATAVFSVLNNKWLKKPTRETFNLDKKAIKQKADAFIEKLRVS